jgi:multimeric flavodoxin WrbA
MKVLLINGSPREGGCTFTALSEAAGVLVNKGIETELFQIGKRAVYGCVGCRSCAKLGKCVFGDDPCNALVERARTADGFIIGSPVYYAGANGALCALLDRAFYSGGAAFAGKPGAAVVSCRRGGAGSAFDRLNKYFTINQMPVVSSQYWNAVHGNTPEEVRQDEEGLQIMRTLGANMAWLLQSLAAARDKVPLPEKEKRIGTNFIR